mgnify:FL=1
MRKINIKKDGKIETKSFKEKKDFIEYLRKNLDFHGVLKIADDVWSLNVGTSVVFFNYTFALAGRSQWLLQEYWVKKFQEKIFINV